MDCPGVFFPVCAVMMVVGSSFPLDLVSVDSIESEPQLEVPFGFPKLSRFVSEPTVSQGSVLEEINPGWHTTTPQETHVQEERYTRKLALVPVAPSLEMDDREGWEAESHITPLPACFSLENQGGKETLPLEETLAAADSVEENSVPAPQRFRLKEGGNSHTQGT